MRRSEGAKEKEKERRRRQGEEEADSEREAAVRGGPRGSGGDEAARWLKGGPSELECSQGARGSASAYSRAREKKGSCRGWMDGLAGRARGDSPDGIRMGRSGTGRRVLDLAAAAARAATMQPQSRGGSKLEASWLREATPRQRLALPRLASPCLALPRLASPCLALPRHASPRLPSTRPEIDCSTLHELQPTRPSLPWHHAARTCKIQPKFKSRAPSTHRRCAHASAAPMATSSVRFDCRADATRFGSTPSVLSLWPARRVLSNKSSASSEPVPLQSRIDAMVRRPRTCTRAASIQARRDSSVSAAARKLVRKDGRQSPNEAQELTGSFEASGRLGKRKLSMACRSQQACDRRLASATTARAPVMLGPSVFCSLAEPRLFSTVSPRVPLCCAIFFTGPMGARTDPSAHMASARQPFQYAARSPRRSGSGAAAFFFISLLVRRDFPTTFLCGLSSDLHPDLWSTSPELDSASVNGWSGSKLSRTGSRSKTGAACRPSIERARRALT
ncbi:hypothetical protein L1887_52039 [Cichorium endivia]|nr:hypothetical protein L1887_52039 [Cichorium endivia]